ncbi:hypothetical protein BKA69DRAFT_520558 [Paraphysoderma sedebokerense]|nr:hypothetical protein BKA69DRAFT_520558 [Paraphysoderma sedebokerense]
MFALDPFQRYKGNEISLEYFKTHGLTDPIVFPSKEGLDMSMPEELTVWDVAREVGEDVVVDAIYVPNQSEQKFSLKEWANYYSDPYRKKIYNIISLEISGSKLGKRIRRPRLVRQLDWVDTVWPKNLKKTEYPKVQLYCLMSVKNCYTDFHIDFGGSSVFYHLIHGEKIFYFIRPTPANLKKYEKWSSSPQQSEQFLGDAVDECIAVHLKAGETMIIPSGWIHAVFTPADSMVIGGNFLHGLAIPSQIAVFEIEARTNVAPKFRFPYFEKLHWFAADKYWSILQTQSPNLSPIELSGLMVLSTHLLTRLSLSKDPSSSLHPEDRKYIRSSIPKKLCMRPEKLASALFHRANKLVNPREREEDNTDGNDSRSSHSHSNTNQSDSVSKNPPVAKIKLSLKLRNSSSASQSQNNSKPFRLTFKRSESNASLVSNSSRSGTINTDGEDEQSIPKVVLSVKTIRNRKDVPGESSDFDDTIHETESKIMMPRIPQNETKPGDSDRLKTGETIGTSQHSSGPTRLSEFNPRPDSSPNTESPQLPSAVVDYLQPFPTFFTEAREVDSDEDFQDPGIQGDQEYAPSDMSNDDYESDIDRMDQADSDEYGSDGGQATARDKSEWKNQGRLKQVNRGSKGDKKKRSLESGSGKNEIELTDGQGPKRLKLEEEIIWDDSSDDEIDYGKEPLVQQNLGNANYQRGQEEEEIEEVEEEIMNSRSLFLQKRASKVKELMAD